MTFFSHLRTQTLSWWRDVPLPIDGDATHNFQTWHVFETSAQTWCPIQASSNQACESQQRPPDETGFMFSLVTWNVDSTSARPEARILAILSHILECSPAIDIIFFQEVSKAALSTLLADDRVRQRWLSSEADGGSLRTQSFTNMMFLARSRFAKSVQTSADVRIGQIWRTQFPSRFGRDALCCDILVPSQDQVLPSIPTTVKQRIRLVNVHLDSLPISPSRRPQQISIAASLLHKGSQGLIAGDFNPVLLEDENLIRSNHLVDAWEDLHPSEPGYTWGVDGKQPFPPNRLDKIATLELESISIEVLHPSTIPHSVVPDSFSSTEKHQNQESGQCLDEQVPWSDHSGLKYSFRSRGSNSIRSPLETTSHILTEAKHWDDSNQGP